MSSFLWIGGEGFNVVYLFSSTWVSYSSDCKICQPDHTLASMASKQWLFDQKMPVWELNQALISSKLMYLCLFQYTGIVVCLKQSNADFLFFLLVFLCFKGKLSPKCNLRFFCVCILVKPSCKSIITTKVASKSLFLKN